MSEGTTFGPTEHLGKLMREDRATEGGIVSTAQTVAAKILEAIDRARQKRRLPDEILVSKVDLNKLRELAADGLEVVENVETFGGIVIRPMAVIPPGNFIEVFKPRSLAERERIAVGRIF